MGRETHEDAARTGGTGRAAGGMMHPRCEGCDFTFKGSSPVFVCEGASAPTAGRCGWCLSRGPSGERIF